MDAYRLGYEIKKNGYTVKDFCKKIGIVPSSYYRKCERETFTLKEINLIVELLNCDPMEIFFTQKVS